MQSKKPNISKLAFWDVDFDALDFERDSALIMERVFNGGTWEDVKTLFSYYGRERLKQEVLSIDGLSAMAVNFLCVVLDLEEKEFNDVPRVKPVRNLNWNGE